MVACLPYASISGIEWNPVWESIPLIVRAYNVGDYYHILRIMPLLRKMNIRIFLSNSSDSFVKDLKFLSSLGIDCGLTFDNKSPMPEDDFLDLASFYYLSKGSHASIEPFEFILRHLTEDKNVNFSAVYFEDPVLFTSSFEINSSNDLADKMDSYYSHFMNLNECSMCSAFKICNHSMKNVFTNCSLVMKEIYDMAEIKSQLNNQYHQQKSVCQL